MLGGNSKPTVPIFLDENNLQDPANASNQLQLFGNLPVGYNVDPVNYFGTEHSTPTLRANKQGREREAISRQQKLQISLNHDVCHDEADRVAPFSSQNPVSAGLRLSYDDDEHNSSVTSASGSMATPSSVILSLSDTLRNELKCQKEEFDQYIKTRVQLVSLPLCELFVGLTLLDHASASSDFRSHWEEILAKGVRDIKQRHTASFLTAI